MARQNEVVIPLNRAASAPAKPPRPAPIDRMHEAFSAQMTGGLSPASLALAFLDLSIHLSSAPGKQMELADKAARKAGRLLAYIAAASVRPDTPPCIAPLPGDYRFRAEQWRKQPYYSWVQAFLLTQQWCIT
jgi:polyhydroxyalkanoate synthase